MDDSIRRASARDPAERAPVQVKADREPADAMSNGRDAGGEPIEGHSMYAVNKIGRVVGLAFSTAFLMAPVGARAAVPLPGNPGQITVDDAGGHVFVSLPSANAIDEFDFSGNLLWTMTIPGADGMVLVGRTLYVAENNTGEIVKLDLSAAAPAPTIVTSGLNGPQYLVMTGGDLWVTEDSSVASVDPVSGLVTPLPTSYYDADLATSPGAPNTLFIAEDGLSPGAVFRLDVTTSPPTVAASNTSTPQENIEGIAVSPDGTRVIPASGYPYFFEELSAATLAPDGLRYPGQAYPSAVAVSASGAVATGLAGGGDTPNLEVLPLGSPLPTFATTVAGTSSFGSTGILPHGLALSADALRVFAVTEDDVFHAIPTFAPSATTGAASAITASSAALTGTVDPNGAATTYTFEYGPSLSFGSITTVSSAGAGSSAVAESASLTGLSPVMTYYYRLVASNAGSTTFGTVSSFTTPDTTPAPVVVTGAASSVANTTATVAGAVNPEGQPTSFTFEYGLTTSFGAISTVVELDNARAVEQVQASLTGLTPNHTYLYRVVATNATGTTSGSVQSFTTGPGGTPVVSTGGASQISGGTATLAGTVDPRASRTTFAFEYGTTTGFGSLSAVDNAGSGIGSEAVSLGLGGLTPNTTYLYRIVATNSNGTTAGSVRSFQTGSVPPPPACGTSACGE